MKKIVFSWVVCVLALVGLFAWMGSHYRGEALIVADFELQSGDKPVRDEDLRGRYLLVYFGFTHCPDICPTTLLLMNNAIQQMGAKGTEILPVFISVDPERDTPQAAAAYAKNFGKNVLGLSGTPAQIKHVADNFKVFYSKVEDKGSALGYVVDHSSFIYLMDPDGNYVTHFASDIPEQELKKELTRYVH